MQMSAPKYTLMKASFSYFLIIDLLVAAILNPEYKLNERVKQAYDKYPWRSV